MTKRGWRLDLGIIVACWLAATVVAVPAPGASAQKRSRIRRAPATAPKLSPVRAEAVRAARDLRTSLEALRAIHDEQAVQAAGRIPQLEQLFTQGIVSRKEVDDAKAGVAEARGKADDDVKQIAETDATIAELLTPDPIFAPGPINRRGYRSSFGMSGVGSWTLTMAPIVERYFTSRFGHSLPITAFGQSAVHNRLGFDHTNAMDVGLHPDSAEGQALIGFLRQQGIPFLAFRGPIPGVATGAHIHIGRASHRF